MKNHIFRLYNSIVALLIICTVFSCKKSENCEETTPTPIISIDTSSLYIYGEDSVSVTITVTPPTETQWNLAGLPEWLSAEPNHGTISDQQIITLTGIPAGLTNSEHDSQTIEIITESASKVGCNIYYSLVDYSSIHPENEYHTIEYNYNETIISLKNYSQETLQWMLDPEVDYLQVIPNSGTLGEFETAEITVVADKSSLGSGEHTSLVHLTDSKDAIHEFEINIKNYIEEKWLLEKVLIKTAYDLANDRIVAITREPYEFLLIYPDEEVIESIALDYYPKSIAVDPTGAYAAIGNDNGYLTLVDLNDLSLKSFFVYDDYIYSLVFGNNDKLYFNFYYSSNDSIYIYDLNTEDIKGYREPWMAAGETLNLHPSGDYLYSFDGSTGIKYDISSDSIAVANRIYTGQSQGSRILFNQNGSKMYVGDDVFRSSENTALDFDYITSCTEVNNNVFMDYSAINHRLISRGNISNYWDQQLFLLEESTLTITNTLDIPMFFTDYGPGYASDGFCYMAYYNSEATKIYALLTPTSSNSNDNWAIMIYDNNN